GAIKEGKIIHNHLYSNGNEPAVFLNNVLLNMYDKFNLLDEARLLFDQMRDRNVVSWTTVISTFFKAKLNEEALRCLVLMYREGVMPNMYTYSSVLKACDGLETLRQLHCCMLRVVWIPNVFVRSALIDIYSKWGELDNGLLVFNEMITGDLIVWNSIIGGLAQNDKGDEALDMFKGKIDLQAIIGIHVMRWLVT
ncbi:hypothetical protein MKX01_028276, partial [Papaver californicum]